MSYRDGLFIALLFGGVGLLRAALFPLSAPVRVIEWQPGPSALADFRDTLDRVNRSFREEWRELELTPSDRADDLTIARRISLGLTGTIPSLEEIRRFESAPSDVRLAGWTEYLLRDRRFGDYFAARLGRAYLGPEEGLLLVFRKNKFLAWLGAELTRNRPYDELVRDLIASSGLNTDRPAVNFIAAAFDADRQAPDAEKLAVRVSRAFLGLRLDCAQCHDHFLEPSWRQDHFQALAAFFGQTHQAATVVFDGDGEYRYENRVTGEKLPIAPAVPFSPELLPDPGTRRERLAAWVTHPENRHFARATVNRIWAMLLGRPLLQRVEAETLDEDGPEALDLLAADFVAHRYDLRRLIHLIVASEPFRRSSAADFPVTELHERTWAVFPLTRLRPEQLIGGVLQASSVTTINRQSNVITRVSRYFKEKEFVERYGDPGDDEFADPAGTIPQRLLVMNGTLVDEACREDLFNACGQIALLAADDLAAVEVAYLGVLTRRPTPAELGHFVKSLGNARGEERIRRMADLYWTLINSTEMSWHR